MGFPVGFPGEVNHIRRIVLACERDMEDFTAAMDAVNVDLDAWHAWGGLVWLIWGEVFLVSLKISKPILIKLDSRYL